MGNTLTENEKRTVRAIMAATRCPRCRSELDGEGRNVWLFCARHGCGATTKAGTRCRNSATYPEVRRCGIHLHGTGRRTADPLPVTEYAIEMSGGSMQVRNDAPEVEAVYPLDDWLGLQLWQGSHVWRRKVVVTQEWERVTLADLDATARAVYDEQSARFGGVPRHR